MGSLVSCFSHFLYTYERISQWLSCISLILCLMLTIIATLAIGIGLGYNYCLVEIQNKYRLSLRGQYVFPPGHPRWHPPQREEDDQDYHEIEGTEALRTPQLLPDTETRPNNDKTPGSPRENQLVDIPFNTGNKTVYYHPIFYDSELTTETESLEETSVDVVTNNESTDVSERIQKRVPESLVTTEKLEDVVELNSTISIYSESSSINTNATEVMIESLSVTSEPPPALNEKSATALVSDPSSRKEKNLIIPISDLDLVSFLSKLSENKNYSLQIVTT